VATTAEEGVGIGAVECFDRLCAGHIHGRKRDPKVVVNWYNVFPWVNGIVLIVWT
jgi:hypothetical protein